MRIKSETLRQNSKEFSGNILTVFDKRGSAPASGIFREHPNPEWFSVQLGSGSSIIFGYEGIINAKLDEEAIANWARARRNTPRNVDVVDGKVAGIPFPGITRYRELKETELQIEIAQLQKKQEELIKKLNGDADDEGKTLQS